MIMKISDPQRLQALPPYLFVEIDRKKKEALARGVDVIDLGVGDPDLPTPEIIRQALHLAIDDPANHRYPLGRGRAEFRQAVTQWMQQRFGVSVDPEQEVLALIGSKDGIGHAPLALVNPGDVVLVPDPGYPVYYSSTVFAGAEPVSLPLRKENKFRPDVHALPSAIVKRARMMFLNYPNNPTSATVDLAFLKNLVAWCCKHNILLAYDMAYSEIYYEGDPPPSVLQIPAAREVAIEFHSFSKNFSMAGWRIGFAVGRPELIQALAQIKSNLDSGTVSAVQVAATKALEHAAEIVPPLVDTYRRRRDVFVQGLQAAGFDLEPPRATFYVWCPVPTGVKSTAFATRLLGESGVVATPGVGFGAAGENYVRFALTSSEERLLKALKRLRTLG